MPMIRWMNLGLLAFSLVAASCMLDSTGLEAGQQPSADLASGTGTGGAPATGNSVSGTGGAPSTGSDATGGETPTSTTSAGEDGQMWATRQMLTLDLGFDGIVDDFPLLVVLDSSRIDYELTQDKGQDLRFTDEGVDTIFPHEIERWNENGKSYVWVKVPQIKRGNGAQTKLWMYYGNPAASDGQNAAGVWAPSFEGVWHLDDLRDSSGHNGDATNVGADTKLMLIGEGRSLRREEKDFIDTKFKKDLGTFTIEVWASSSGDASTSAGPTGPLMRGSNFQIAWDHKDWQFHRGVLFREAQNDQWSGVQFAELKKDTFYYLAATFNGNTFRCFRNGTQEGERWISAPKSESATAKIGRHESDTDDDKFMTLDVDEVRIANTARSNEWIKAQHRSMKDDGFVSIGDKKNGPHQIP